MGHIPEDKSIVKIANKLGLDEADLILAAHQQKVLDEFKGFFLAPLEPKDWKRKRRFPLSDEQCNYLARIMTAQEIQKYR